MDSTAQFSVYSIAFAYDGAFDAILLRDDQDRLVGATPEWVAGRRRRVPAAYVRGARPTVQVCLSLPRTRRAPGSEPPTNPIGECTISATGTGGPGIEPRRIELQFDAGGRTAPIELRLSEPLPNRSGRLRLRWSWQVELASKVLKIGTTSHDICLTARPILDPASWLGTRLATKIQVCADEPPRTYAASWTYAAIVKWTCAWTAGLVDDKAIVDAIMKNLWRSGLRYGVMKARSIRQMLIQKGAYCGVWARMFQAMAASQGVEVLRRGLYVDWRVRSDRALWCAMVVRSGGINRKAPVVRSRTFHDAAWPVRLKGAVRRVRDRRYYFWGKPPYWPKAFDDGHMFNILKYGKSQYLYDPSFERGPIRLSKPWPAAAPRTRVDVASLGNFHRVYLCGAVDFMLGSLPWGSHTGTASGEASYSRLIEKVKRYGLTIPTSRLKRRGVLTFLLP